MTQGPGDDGDEVEHLPDVYLQIRDRYPQVAEALDELGQAGEEAGPLTAREQRLATLGIAIGGLAKGSVRSNTRKALGVGLSPEEVRHVAVLAITTRGFPAAVAGLGWMDEVLEREA